MSQRLNQQKKRNRLLLVVGIVIVTISFWAIGAILMERSNRNRFDAIANFEECVAAGNPISGYKPRECRTPLGQLFYEQLDQPAIGTEYPMYRPGDIFYSTEGPGAPFQDIEECKSDTPYTYESLGFSIECPTGWYVATDDLPDGIVYFLTKERKDHLAHSFVPAPVFNVLVRVYKDASELPDNNSESTLSFEEWINRRTETWKSVMVNGVQGYADHVISDGDYYIIMVEKNDVVFKVVSDGYPPSEQQRQVIDSFRFLN